MLDGFFVDDSRVYRGLQLFVFFALPMMIGFLIASLIFLPVVAKRCPTTSVEAVR